MSQRTHDDKEVVLGRKYKDIIHGIEGTAMARYEFLMGCDRILVEYVEGGKIENQTFDVMQLVEATDDDVVAERRATGGPARQAPPSRDPR